MTLFWRESLFREHGDDATDQLSMGLCRHDGISFRPDAGFNVPSAGGADRCYESRRMAGGSTHWL